MRLSVAPDGRKLGVGTGGKTVALVDTSKDSGSVCPRDLERHGSGLEDTYLNTDVSSKAEAAAMHINYSAIIGKVKGLPEIYLIQGRAAHAQLAIFGSQPGEKNYSPLWAETILTWKAGAKPVLITSDTQINKIEKMAN